MSAATPLALQAGEPYNAQITVTNGKDVWATLDLFEVRCQARRYQNESATLLADLSTSCTAAYAGNDIVITMSLTGAQTRALTGKSGYYDLFVSDVGVTDARAYRILHGPFNVTPAVTTAS